MALQQAFQSLEAVVDTALLSARNGDIIDLQALQDQTIFLCDQAASINNAAEKQAAVTAMQKVLVKLDALVEIYQLQQGSILSQMQNVLDSKRAFAAYVKAQS